MGREGKKGKGVEGRGEKGRMEGNKQKQIPNELHDLSYIIALAREK